MAHGPSKSSAVLCYSKEQQHIIDISEPYREAQLKPMKVVNIPM